MNFVEPNLLVVLHHLLRTRSVTEAAIALKTTQPAVSRTLKRLREEIGDPLLIRNGNQMVLTQRAESILPNLDRWMNDTRAVLQSDQFDPGSVKRRIRIASTDFGVRAVIAPFYRQLRRKAVDIELQIAPLVRNPTALLAAGECDLAISGLPHDARQLHMECLFVDELACLMGRDHSLAKSKGRLTKEEYFSVPHVGLMVSEAEIDTIDKRFGPLAPRRDVRLRVPYFSAAVDFLVGTQLLVTMPSRQAQWYSADAPFVTRLAPTELGTLAYHLLWHERSHRDPAMEWLRTELIEFHKGLSEGQGDTNAA